MSDLSRVWSQKKLSLWIKLRICAVLRPFICAIRGASLAANSLTSCVIRAVTSMTGLESIATIITRRRTALFGHLDNIVPANRALDLAINVRNCHPQDPSWKRPRGRPRQTWLHQIESKPSDLRSALDAAVLRGHGQCRRDGPPLSTHKKEGNENTRIFILFMLYWVSCMS